VGILIGYGFYVYPETGKRREFTDAEKRDQREKWLELLNKLCPDAKFDADKDGKVAPTNKKFCAELAESARAGCKCLCKLLDDSKHDVELIATNTDLHEPAHTTPNDDGDMTDPTKGAGATLNMRFGDTYYLKKTKNGKTTTEEIEPYVVLGHELCGHVTRMFEGKHPAGGVTSWVVGSCDDCAVDAENDIRTENNLTKREKDDTVVDKPN